MIQATSCPSAPVLQRLLLGQSADEESVSLEAHLLHCDKCLQTIKSLPPDDALISSLQQGRNFDTQAPRSELLEKLRMRLQTMTAARNVETATAENTHPNAPTPSAEMMGYEIVAMAPPQQPDEIGRLGGYRVLKELGRGGMGAVYQAEDPKLKRLVALKVMLPRLAADASARRRFLREAQAMAAVHHDHVVTIYQVDEDNGVPFLAMEYLHGVPLDKWLRDGRKPNLAQILRMGREIAEGLAAAHARGLIHRDIKPGNIWLDSDHKDRVKILDFGLARVGTEDVHLTRTGAVVGTPAYMSPEQAAGQKVDARTDLFSLGCILYRFCTGAMPFSGDTTMALLTALAIADPKPVRDLNPAIPAPLADLVMRLLAKKPADRPASAQEVADQLAAIEAIPQSVQVDKNDGESQTEVLAAESRSSARLAKPKSRSRTAILALMGAPAALVVAAAFVIIRYTDKDGKPGQIRIEPPPGATDVTATVGATDSPIPKPAFPLLDEAWAKKVRSLPAEKQVEEVAAELMRRNPDFDGKGAGNISNGEVVYFSFLAGEVTDLTPARALPELKTLICRASGKAKGRLSDLSPLKGLKLTTLDFRNTQASDLSPLRGMPLTNLLCQNTPVSDLTPLKDMKLTYLDCAYTQISDLSPLKRMPLKTLYCGATNVLDLFPLTGMKLEDLNCGHTGVSDLSPLKGMKITTCLCDLTAVSDLSPLSDMPVTTLYCGGSKVSDLSPLRHMPLKLLNCDFEPARDTEILRSIKTLEQINDKPAAEFWKEVEAKAAEKKP